MPWRRKNRNQESSRPKRRLSLLTKLRSGSKRRRKGLLNDTPTYNSSPQRSISMPYEIDLAPGTPSSLYSDISGITGVAEESKGRSMMTSMLPDLDDEQSENPSLSFLHTGRSIFGFSPSPVKRSKRQIEPASIASQATQKPSFLARTWYFKRMVKKVFHIVDTDKSGAIDKKELYAGLLMIHLKLAAYVGPAACEPVSREYVCELFDEMDVDKSGTLNKTEFSMLMSLLCSHILTRLTIQVSMLLMLIPIISQYIAESIRQLIEHVYILWNHIDEKEKVSEHLMRAATGMMDMIWLWIPSYAKEQIFDMYAAVEQYIPARILSTLPVTIISSVFTCLLVPKLLNICDYFFDGRTKKTKKMKEP